MNGGRGRYERRPPVAQVAPVHSLGVASNGFGCSVVLKCFPADFMPLEQSVSSTLCSNEEASAASCPFTARDEDAGSKQEVLEKTGCH